MKLEAVVVTVTPAEEEPNPEGLKKLLPSHTVWLRRDSASNRSGRTHTSPSGSLHRGLASQTENQQRPESPLTAQHLAMNKGKASGVSWVKPAEPSFLKKFKTDVGYKEGPNVDTKRQAMPTPDDDSGSDKEDELPQVVVLKSGDLSADEVKKLKGELRAGDEGEKGQDATGGGSVRSVKTLRRFLSVLFTGEEAPPDGKILFKKPAKRSSSDKFQGIAASSSKKKKEERAAEQEEDRDRKSGKKVKNNSLLSFGDDEEEEND
ncbi:hypothetical protein CCH79_00018181 [Gambusia affinis]|uniref:DUF4604 domain-containing protein n=1 Tax=Gambusia affinis TaxID=33528 RepID=A0A315VI07_GAMAF|nr:hypothetical protein CCH79_00018181 [Gambusia affinis]